MQVQPVLGTVSPDGSWLSAVTRLGMFAMPTNGGTPVHVFPAGTSRLRWTPDGTRILVGIQVGSASAWGFGRTYALPLKTGSMLPDIPTGGFKNEADLAALPGVEIFPYGDMTFSPTAGVYAYSKIVATRNLYRIPLP